MRYALYGIVGLMLAFAAIVSAGASAQAAPAGSPSGLSENTLVLKVHDGEHHQAKKSTGHSHKGVCTHKRRHHARRHSCHHKGHHGCRRHHDDD